MAKIYKVILIFVAIFFTFCPIITYAQGQKLSRAEQEFRERYVDGADLICIGKVISRPVSAPPNLLQVEFDPNWQIVIIEVSNVSVGKSKKGDRIQVIFPGTVSLVWSGSPKLVLGEEYVFILQDLTLYKNLLKKPEQVKRGQYYLAISPERVQPKNTSTKIKSMVH